MVLVRYDAGEEIDEMSNRRVARLHLLFSIPDTESDSGRKIDLAFVQLFRTIRPPDPISGQYKVVKDRFDVIDMDTIERGVHLIPCFKGFESSMATANSAPALDVYREFFINNHVDIHIYNTVY